MKVLKYSRQREIIKNYLASVTSHPTASDIYDAVKDDIPHISLGTVYRNVSLLVEMGEARRLTDLSGTDHFDANIRPHAHFVCSVCQRIFDFDAVIDRSIEDMVPDDFDGEVTDYDLYYYGKCPECI